LWSDIAGWLFVRADTTSMPHGMHVARLNDTATTEGDIFMPHLPDRIRDAADALARGNPSGSRVPARYERAAREAVCSEYVRAQHDAARVKRIQRTGELGIQATEDLTNTEALALMSNPMGESRYKLIADNATIAIARVVADAGRD
jgi:hypothetical protein